MTFSCKCADIFSQHLFPYEIHLEYRGFKCEVLSVFGLECVDVVESCACGGQVHLSQVLVLTPLLEEEGHLRDIHLVFVAPLENV